jgi:hypothetical protein
MTTRTFQHETQNTAAPKHGDNSNSVPNQAQDQDLSRLEYFRDSFLNDYPAELRARQLWVGGKFQIKTDDEGSLELQYWSEQGDVICLCRSWFFSEIYQSMIKIIRLNDIEF